MKLWETKGSVNESMNSSVTEVFVEQLLASPGSAKYLPNAKFTKVSVSDPQRKSPEICF